MITGSPLTVMMWGGGRKGNVRVGEGNEWEGGTGEMSEGEARWTEV